jgi:two-component system NtrC family sensor kinase
MFLRNSHRSALIRKPSLTWPLRVIAALSVLAPLVILAYATWSNQREIEERTEERIERALDVLQEHALKALQTVERTIAETNEVLRPFSDDQIRAEEARLSDRLRRTQESLPQIQSIWAFDGNGRPLVSSTVLPVPRIARHESTPERPIVSKSGSVTG